MKKVKSAYIYMNYVRSVIIYLFVRKHNSFERDLERWCIYFALKGTKKLYAFTYLMVYYKEFRNLVIARIREKSFVKSVIAKILFKPIETLIFGTQEIGGGMFIEHGFATIISAKSIGEDCWINQQVTIGYGSGGKSCPVIGDRVMIRAGAIVVGGITIGNDVTIAAGAVVVHDVPSNTVVAGVPAKVVKYKNDKNTHDNINEGE